MTHIPNLSLDGKVQALKAAVDHIVTKGACTPAMMNPVGQKCLLLLCLLKGKSYSTAYRENICWHHTILHQPCTKSYHVHTPTYSNMLRAV